MRLLENKVAIITGSGRGIGRAAAELFADQGASLVLNSTREETCKAVAEAVVARGGKCIYVVGDVSEDDMPERLMNAALDNFGKLDIIVNNAGINGGSKGGRISALEMPFEDWRRVMEVNLDAPLRLMMLAIPYFKENGGGKIVNICSRLAKVPQYYAPHYPVSKAGLLHLTRCLAKQFAKDKIYVNAILPGPIETEMTSDWTAEHKNRILSECVMGRMAQPSEIASVILFLSSAMSDFITGEAVNASGGGLMD